MWNAYVITQADTEGEVLSIMKDLRSKHPDVDCVGGKFLVREPDHPITRINLKDLRADGAYYKNYHVANKLLRPGVPIADYSKKEVDKIMHEDHGYEVDVYR